MAKLKLQLNSTSVLGIYGRVDISFNGIKVGDNVELSATTSTLVYDVASISTDSENTIKIDVLNPRAIDNNRDGDFRDEGDESMEVTVSLVQYSLDDSTYTTIIPQIQSTFTVPSGANSGQVVELKPAINTFGAYNLNYQIKFTTDGGLVSNQTDHTQPWNPVSTLIDGNKVLYTDGNIYDFDGKIVE